MPTTHLIIGPSNFRFRMQSSSETAPAQLPSMRVLSFLLLIAMTAFGVACGGGSASSGSGGGNGGGSGGNGSGGGKTTTPPPQPTDITPINGEVYYVLNQSSGLRADLIGNS